MEVVIEATVLGIASLVGFGLTWTRIPGWLRTICTDHPLLTDAALTFAAYEIAGGSLRGIMAAAVVSVIVSILLYYSTAKKKLRARRKKRDA